MLIILLYQWAKLTDIFDISLLLIKFQDPILKINALQ